MECLYLYLKVDGMLVSVCSSNDGVWGVSANGELWVRAGLDQVLFFQKKLTNLLLSHRQIVQYLFKVPSVFCVASVHSVFSVSSINFVLPLLSIVGLGVFLLFLNRSVPFCSVRSPRTMSSP